MSWPGFDTPAPLDERRSWTARFDSYDQKNDDCYYVVTLREAGVETSRFMVQVAVWWMTGLSDEALASRLGDELAAAAARGRTNTAYEGPVMRP